MRNKIEKTNKTKFDYKARILGVVGIAIFALTVIIGGNTLLTISNENKALINLVETPTNNKTFANKANNTDLETKNVEIIIEEE